MFYHISDDLILISMIFMMKFKIIQIDHLYIEHKEKRQFGV